MKYAILFVIGLFVGAAAAAIVVNTLNKRDAYSRGVMNVMAHHMGALDHSIRTQRCDVATTTHAITQMRALSGDIAPAIFPDSTPEPPFREFVDRFNEALVAVPSPPPAECAALAPLANKIGKVCEDCHQQYR